MPANPNHGGLWTEKIWQNIDATVNRTAMALSVAQKVFPATQLSDVMSVPADTIDPNTLLITEGTTRPYVEVAVSFTLTNGQVNSDPTAQTMLRAATSAATKLAGAVDAIFFQGQEYDPAAPVQIASGTIYPGLLTLSNGNYIVQYAYPPADTPTTNSGVGVLTSVQNGLGAFADKQQTPPFALIVGAQLIPGTSQTAQTLTMGSQINGVPTPTVLNPLLTGGIIGTSALPGFAGLLIALGGNPTTVYYSDNTLTELVARNNDGSFLFRVFYRTQIAPSDSRAFVRLKYPGDPWL
jgi:hypothetical protein